jgi:hypothetical protein
MDTFCFGCYVGLDDTCHRALVSDGDGLVTQCMRLGNYFFWVGSAGKEGKITPAMKFGKFVL